MARLAVLCCLLLAPVVALADDAKPAGPPQPAPALVELGKFFVGTWNCTMKWNASPMGPAHEAKGKATFKWSPGKFWLNNDYKEMKSKANPMPFEVVEHFGFNAAKNEFVRLDVDNFGGWTTGTSPGWTGDKMVITSESHMPDGTQATETFTFTKKGPKQIEIAISNTDAAGKSIDLGGGTCKK